MLSGAVQPFGVELGNALRHQGRLVVGLRARLSAIGATVASGSSVDLLATGTGSAPAPPLAT